MDLEGNKKPLPVYVTSKGSQIYNLRAFHQMHCISILFEDIGYLRNNVTPKWTAGHELHCLNTLRAAVTCLADSTPIAYIHGLGVGHTTDDQQTRCRNFFALREWAHDPVRAVRWMNYAPEGTLDHYVELDREI